MAIDFTMTEEQELLLSSIRELINNEFPEEYFRTHDEEGKYPREFVKALAENGISLLGVPEEHGGIPADYVTQMLAIMEIAKCGAPAFLMTNGQCMHSMIHFGSPEQLRLTAESTSTTGDPAYSLALTEPGAGSDNNAATTTWERKDGKIVINGQKTFITGAAEYPYMLVLARDPKCEDPKLAFSLFWVDAKAPGVKINPLHKIGWHLVSTCEVYLDNVVVEEKDMVGEEGKGFLNVMYNFEMERLINASRCTGFAECAFEDAARYANQRIAFGKPIGFNQMIQEKLALMKVKCMNMRHLVLSCAVQADRKESMRETAALAKLYCARTALEVIDDAIQIMGGLGYTNDARVSRLWRDVRCERIGGGTDEIMIYIAGRQILKAFRDSQLIDLSLSEAQICRSKREVCARDLTAHEDLLSSWALFSLMFIEALFIAAPRSQKALAPRAMFAPSFEKRRMLLLDRRFLQSALRRCVRFAQLPCHHRNRAVKSFRIMETGRKVGEVPISCGEVFLIGRFQLLLNLLRKTRLARLELHEDPLCVFSSHLHLLHTDAVFLLNRFNRIKRLSRIGPIAL